MQGLMFDNQAQSIQLIPFYTDTPDNETTFQIIQNLLMLFLFLKHCSSILICKTACLYFNLFDPCPCNDCLKHIPIVPTIKCWVIMKGHLFIKQVCCMGISIITILFQNLYNHLLSCWNSIFGFNMDLLFSNANQRLYCFLIVEQCT